MCHSHMLHTCIRKATSCLPSLHPPPSGRICFTYSACWIAKPNLTVYYILPSLEVQLIAPDQGQPHDLRVLWPSLKRWGGPIRSHFWECEIRDPEGSCQLVVELTELSWHPRLADQDADGGRYYGLGKVPAAFLSWARSMGETGGEKQTWSVDESC